MDYKDFVSDARSPSECQTFSRNRVPYQRPSRTRPRTRSVSQSYTGPRAVSSPKEEKSRDFFSSIFGRFSSSSLYRRSPRKNYMYHKAKMLCRLLRDLVHYMKRNPYKVIELIIIPLLVSGTFSKLLAKFGIRLPASLQKALRNIAGIGKLWIKLSPNPECKTKKCQKFAKNSGGIISFEWKHLKLL